MKTKTNKQEEPATLPVEAPKKKTAGAPKKYPTKTTINLAMKEESKSNWKKRIPIFLLVGLLAILGVKFGVVDMLIATSEVENQALVEEGMVQDVQVLLLDYPRVEDEHYNYTLDRRALKGSKVSVMESLELVEKYLTPAAKIQNFSVQGDVITVTLNEVTLDDISTIYNTLREDDQITDVRVYTATTKDGVNDKTTCNMTVFLLNDSYVPETEGDKEK